MPRMRRSFRLFAVAAIVLSAAIVHSTRTSSAIAADADPDTKKSAATFEVYQDKAGEWRWRLRTKNTQVIATSGAGYKEKRSCLDGIESVKKNAADAPVKE